MKTLNCIMIRIAFISVLFLALLSKGQSQTKKALVIAIGNYPASSNWPVISSGNDIPYMLKTLQRQGFESGNITVLKDSEATKAGIEAALKSFTNKLRPADIAIIHFSCHGAQLQDDNGDEPDGLDEVLVPFNAVYTGTTGDLTKDSANYLRDDLFGKYVRECRGKLGPEGDLLVLINACHSGTITRGSGKSRGGKPAIVAKNAPDLSGKGPDKVQQFKEGGESENNLATYIIYSAASANEVDKEVTDNEQMPVGSLTYAISAALEQLPEHTSYRSLFARIQSVMLEKSLRQHPVMEGNGIDRSLFGGRFIEQQSFSEIAKRLNTREYILKKGSLAGLDVGAKVGVFPATTQNIQGVTPMASGVVTAAGPFSSTIKLDADPKLAQITAGWVFVTEPVFKIPVAIVKIETKKVSKGSNTVYTDLEIENITKQLSPVKVVTGDETANLLLKKGGRQDSLIMISNGLTFSVNEAGEQARIDWLKTALQQYSQYVFIRDLAMVEAKSGLEVKLVPWRNGEPDTGKAVSSSNMEHYKFSVKDTVVLWVTNYGKQSLYINILDLLPDGSIQPILPNKGQKIFPEDLKIRAGESKIFSNYTISLEPPFGTEVFKIFTSRGEMNMEDLVITKGSGTRGASTYMEKLFKKSFGILERGDLNTTGLQEGSASSLIFEIVPAKKK